MTFVIKYVCIPLAIVLVLAILANLISLIVWYYRRRFKNTNTGYEGKMIKKYLKILSKSCLWLIVLGIVTVFYFRQITFSEVAELKGKNINEINFFRGRNKVINDEEQVEEVLRILSKYKLRISLTKTHSDNVSIIIGGDPIGFEIYIEGEKKPKTVEVWSNGYITTTRSGKVYRILSESNEELYNELVNY